MYNLLFVDDERRVLDAIRVMLPWNEMEIRVVGCCDNAVSALEIMINEYVDILITDIKMPIMDGLELINRAKEMYPEIECMVLSGYEEFELAKAAIACGVRGYMLKPCKKEELENGIKECVDIIRRKQHAVSYQFEQRQRQIEKLCDELLSISIENTERDYMNVREASSRYQDYGILKEAIITIAVEFESALGEFHHFGKKLAQIMSSEQLIQYSAEILRKIHRQTNISDPIVKKMVKYINEHYDITSLTVQSVADSEIHLTSRYIGQRFLKEMNMKFSDYLLQVRMEKVIEYLNKRGDCSAEEIADKVGLGNNIQYFYRLFRSYTGMTLKEYKDKLNKKGTE